MKSLLLIGLFFFLFSTNNVAQSLTQNESKINISQGYYELNFGAALIKGDMEGPFPGVSFLFGRKTYFKNKLIIDAEIGIAFPSIATAKLGFGFKTKSSEYIFGIRPWPMHFYVQTQLNSTQKGGWVMSFELSPYLFKKASYEEGYYGMGNNAAYKVSMQSLGMLTFGYRWNSRSK